VTLFQNPVFVTQQRLLHRAGMLTGLLATGLIGLGLLGGLVCCLAAPDGFRFPSAQDAGKTFYGWLLTIEMLVLVLGGFSRISRTLVEERKAGLWDSNRLTPLKPSQLVTGYWLGPALWMFCLGAVLALAGLAIAAIAGLPLAFWLKTQSLALSTALMSSLLAVLVGLVAERSQSGLLLLLLVPVLFSLSESHPPFMIMSYLLPIHAMADLFHAGGQSQWDWHGWPRVFGLPTPTVLCSLAVQTVAGLFLWRAAVRKTARPFEPLFQRRDAVGLFAFLTVAQHGLIWGIWRGESGGTGAVPNPESLLPMMHGSTLLLGMIVLAFASPRLDHMRVEAMRSRLVNTSWILSRSGVMTALALSAVAGLALLAHFAAAQGLSGAQWQICLTGAGSLLAVFVAFSALLEICRLRFRRHALVFLALALFALSALPFALEGIFFSPELRGLSLLAPGVMALARPEAGELNTLTLTTVAHLAIAAGLILSWRLRWKCFLETDPSLASPILCPPQIPGK
jgi:hypothetical protein